MTKLKFLREEYLLSWLHHMAMARESSQNEEENGPIGMGNYSQSNNKKDIEKKETPFFPTTRNGIVEIVSEIISKSKFRL